jgi:hypothetical protein
MRPTQQSHMHPPRTTNPARCRSIAPAGEAPRRAPGELSGDVVDDPPAVEQELEYDRSVNNPEV